jgi:hypothetical protein
MMEEFNKTDWSEKSYESPDGSYKVTSYYKVFDLSDLDESKILKHYEDSEHYYNAWSALQLTIEVCQPTFSFTKNFLEDAGWTIVDSYNFAEDIILPSQLPKPATEDNKQMQRFAFYAVR